jgi:hypothetical protein
MATVFSCTFITQSGFAQNKQTRKTEVFVGGASDFLPLAKTEGTVDSNETRDITNPPPDSSVPPLTKLYIQNVCTSSAGTGCETISSGQVSTAVTYSGSSIYVYEWEIGFGIGISAMQGGVQLNPNYLTQKLPVCAVSGGYSINCNTPFMVVGYRYVWNVGYSLNQDFGQNFVSQDTSEALPRNTLAATLMIRYTE